MSVRTMHRPPTLLGLIAVLALALSAGGVPTIAQQASISVQPSSAGTGDDFHSSPVMFIENAGQWDERARFQVWGEPAGTMWLAEDAIWITVIERADEAVADSRVDPTARVHPQRANVERENPQRKRANVRLSFVGANLHPRIEPFDRLDTVVKLLRRQRASAVAAGCACVERGTVSGPVPRRRYGDHERGRTVDAAAGSARGR
jgi:hypothetical protein